ncbi:MAG: PorT family protein [Dysgonamonadaceae bacterium]|jgi:hypothetical protein|nr:PorT family protein [Dysgonamonadaceae bacterium]
MNRIRFFALLLPCLIFAVGSLEAQTASRFQPEWSFGFNAGSTLSKVSFNSQIRVPQEYLIQYSGGLTARYISENHVGIQAEINYSLRGWKEQTDTLHLNRYTRSLAYLEIPLLTHIYVNLGKRARFIFNLGPQISYLISDDVITQEINEPDGAIPEYYSAKIQRRFDYGLKGGAGLEFRTGSGSIILDGKYYFGLSDIFNNTRADIFQASSNKVIGINLTYLFRLKQ